MSNIFIDLLEGLPTVWNRVKDLVQETKEELETEIGKKATKVTGATADTEGNILTLAADGDIADSGIKFGDLVSTEKVGAVNGIAELDANMKVKAEQTCSRIVTFSENKTLSLDDAGTMQRCNKFGEEGTFEQIDCIIPNSTVVDFPEGTEIEFCHTGRNISVGICASNGVTINDKLEGAFCLMNQFEVCAIKKILPDTWIISGTVTEA